MLLRSPDQSEIKDVLDALEQAFVYEERRDRAAALEALKDPRYRIHMAQKGEETVGFITVWELDGFCFAEHFVIYPAHRNRGLGSEVLAALKARYARIVLEAEPPEDELKRRRLGFYRRNGFYENSISYLQPSYHGGEGVPLVLISFPAVLEQPAREIREIYREVYGREYPAEG
jgi:ribosomal protein S18 acetylase RimI-like enzyme